ncbi:DUF308 domain-containing protein [Dactylosporangium sp. NPDC048998]|uniref:DUF308 domain-containing protein n=1 Tax=Dactylosporangium sp. NPDC048998 TaxID=3363976 RepID=UPI00371F8783
MEHRLVRLTSQPRGTTGAEELAAARGTAGFVGLVIGIMAIAGPGVTAVAPAILVGIWAVVIGLADLWLATRQHDGWSLALSLAARSGRDGRSRCRFR